MKRPTNDLINQIILEVKKHDNFRFLSSLFAPSDERKALIILYRFNLELAHIAESTNEVMAGLIRLQWWQDTIKSIYNHQIPTSPLAKELVIIIKQYQLNESDLYNLIKVREIDIYREPLKDLKEIEDYAKNSSGTLFKLAAQIFKVTDSQIIVDAENLGISWCLVGLIRNLKYGSNNFLPLNLQENYNLTKDNFKRDNKQKDLAIIIKEMSNLSQNYLNKVSNYNDKNLYNIYCFKYIIKNYLHKFANIDYQVIYANCEISKLKISLSLLYHRVINH